VDFICKIGKKIETLHVSDYDFVNERHWLPGEGKVNWRALIAALREIDYSGVWMYEILFKCPKTILRPCDLTCEDFARNARELFAGEEPTVFSSPKPNLGWWE
jgi:sugar phosphate isomerase/epimerase